MFRRMSYLKDNIYQSRRYTKLDW